MKTRYKIFAVHFGDIMPVSSAPLFENELLAITHIDGLLRRSEWSECSFLILPVYYN